MPNEGLQGRSGSCHFGDSNAVKILVISLLNIGDVLFTTPALRSLRAAYPDARIDMLVNNRSAETVVHNRNLSRVIVIEKSGYHKSPKGFVELIRSIRRERYDTVINLHGCARSSLITVLSGARQRCGLVSRGFDWLYHKPIHQRRDIHRVDSHLQILNDLGIPTLQGLGMEMHVDDASRESAQTKMAEAGVRVEGVYIGLNPGASVTLKQWTAEGWAQLSDLLVEQGYTPVLFGGPGDVPLTDKISELCRTRPSTMSGKLTLLELAAAVTRCQVFVSVDSGPLHIAAAQGVPIVGLYGPTDPIEFGPYRVPNVVLGSSGECDSCRQRLDSGHTCIANIKPPAVFEAVRKLLISS